MSQENINACSNGAHNKSVQFSRFIKISFTYPGDEYDRTALEPAKLTFSEATELMQLRIDWKQEMNRRIEQQLQQQQQQLQDSDDGYSSDERLPVSRSSRSSGLSGVAIGGSSSNAGYSNSSPGSEDEYDQDGPTFSVKKNGSVMMHRHSHLHQSKENMPCFA
ncbi:hypothetical protein BX616_002899 [Lobosporangium transversale]|uniref:Uncharacterized protein n=1 Tax=Lobosporangium transversale TaxID=64571 RepID=A0A1Y2G6J1_9FUNG|nr:hypothetical protein BCR41DRAFT_364481 [Lobosporangium transversale]KAF9899668.1 hypothetical protein BX616_002899 [Lobosporangium transversale]ORY98293.1 hypothetical protein BCR41DRAFT_364481 [Lobosporangium transversale]|eukprot:XP_021875722.1 hypothetical protein BCR41DRAFT_364481 [Lobosporangium transversale]